MDGLPGFDPNRANLNGLVFGGRIRYTPRMRQPGTASAFKTLCQNAAATPALASLSYADAMELAATVPAYRAALSLAPPKPRPAVPLLKSSATIRPG